MFVTIYMPKLRKTKYFIQKHPLKMTNENKLPIVNQIEHTRTLSEILFIIVLYY